MAYACAYALLDLIETKNAAEMARCRRAQLRRKTPSTNGSTGVSKSSIAISRHQRRKRELRLCMNIIKRARDQSAKNAELVTKCADNMAKNAQILAEINKTFSNIERIIHAVVLPLAAKKLNTTQV